MWSFYPSIAPLFVHILVPGKGRRVSRVLHRIKDAANDVGFNTSRRFHDLLPFIFSIGEESVLPCLHVCMFACCDDL